MGVVSRPATMQAADGSLVKRLEARCRCFEVERHLVVPKEAAQILGEQDPFGFVLISLPLVAKRDTAQP